MKDTTFTLNKPHQLDWTRAERLYQAATNQAHEDNKNIFACLRESLQLGGAQSGWILVNYARPGKLENASQDEKNQYFAYLIATAILDNQHAEAELKQVFQQLRSPDLAQLSKILMEYRVLGYAIDKWVPLIPDQLRGLRSRSVQVPTHDPIHTEKVSSV